MKIRFSLESKICILVGALLFALLFAVGYVQMNRYRSDLLAEKVEEYQGLSSMLALTYGPWSSKADLSQYHEFTTRFIESDPDISYIVISDSNGKVLFANTRKHDIKQNRGFVGRQISRVLGVVRWLGRRDSARSTIQRVPAMVRPGERGTITVGFDSHSVDAAMDGLQSYLLYTFAIAMLLGFIGAILIAKAITMPMRQLIGAARQVADGDLDIQVPSAPNDEVGELVDTFNGMVVSLRIGRDKLIERANTDSLTGLHNHRYFQERLRSELKRATRYDRPLSVIMVDIDDFKVMNDTHGHPVGDAILQGVSEILLAGARRDIDVVCRYGGEEFAIIVPETNSVDAVMVAERIRENVAAFAFAGKDGVEVSTTISLGVAEYPVHSSEREGLIMAADLALYQSKSLGKNRTTVFSNDTRVDKDRDPYKLYLLVNATDMSTIEAMAAAVDAKGRRSPEFSRAVVDHAVEIARELGMSEPEQRDVRIASLLRDIGKLGVAADVLNKHEPLTDEEIAMVKSHTTLGYSVVQKSPQLKSMLPGILYHHERWDGAGYPKGLKGEEIPLIARIVAVTDAYHAMLTKRPHSNPRSLEDAKAELLRGAGSQFDPQIVDLFVGILEQEGARSKAA